MFPASCYWPLNCSISCIYYSFILHPGFFHWFKGQWDALLISEILEKPNYPASGYQQFKIFSSSCLVWNSRLYVLVISRFSCSGILKARGTIVEMHLVVVEESCVLKIPGRNWQWRQSTTKRNKPSCFLDTKVNNLQFMCPSQSSYYASKVILLKFSDSIWKFVMQFGVVVVVV